jgi:hypothetical protein
MSEFYARRAGERHGFFSIRNSNPGARCRCQELLPQLDPPQLDPLLLEQLLLEQPEPPDPPQLDPELPPHPLPPPQPSPPPGVPLELPQPEPEPPEPAHHTVATKWSLPPEEE